MHINIASLYIALMDTLIIALIDTLIIALMDTLIIALIHHHYSEHLSNTYYSTNIDPTYSP